MNFSPVLLLGRSRIPPQARYIVDEILSSLAVGLFEGEEGLVRDLEGCRGCPLEN